MTVSAWKWAVDLQTVWGTDKLVLFGIIDGGGSGDDDSFRLVTLETLMRYASAKADAVWKSLNKMEEGGLLTVTLDGDRNIGCQLHTTRRKATR